MTDVKIVSKAVEIWDVDKLKPYDKNAKTHPEAQVKKIAASIKEHGWSKPIEVDTKGVIINGHGRLKAAQLLGMKRVPVVIRDDLSEDQIRKYRLDDNKVAESAFDAEILAEELQYLHLQGMNLEGTFDIKDLDFVLQDIGELDINKIAEDIGAQVEAAAQDTHNRISEDKQTTIGKAMGFGSVTSEQHRVIRLFMTFVEETTGKTGAEALVEYAKEHMGL